MTSDQLTERDWDVRLYVFTFWLEQARPATVSDVAQRFEMTIDEAWAAYHRLNEAHLLFLKPGTDDIFMAHPLSAVETPNNVQAIFADLQLDSPFSQT